MLSELSEHDYELLALEMQKFYELSAMARVHDKVGWEGFKIAVKALTRADMEDNTTCFYAEACNNLNYHYYSSGTRRSIVDYLYTKGGTPWGTPFTDFTFFEIIGFERPQDFEEAKAFVIEYLFEKESI
jgi:hypothetical protein